MVRAVTVGVGGVLVRPRITSRTAEGGVNLVLWYALLLLLLLSWRRGRVFFVVVDDGLVSTAVVRTDRWRRRLRRGRVGWGVARRPGQYKGVI